MERVLERRLRKLTEMNEMQYAFCGKRTIDTLLIVTNSRKLLQEKVEVDLETASDRVPREVIE